MPDASTSPRSHSNKRRPVAPDEALFRRRDAPTRYEEHDIYAADRELADRGIRLPDSDLLGALHAYVSDFYAAMERKGEDVRADWRSMDETALLGMGILLEEMCKEALGETGHLALLESEGEQDPGDLAWNGRTWVPSVLRRQGMPRVGETRKRGDASEDDGTEEESEEEDASVTESDEESSDEESSAEPPVQDEDASSEDGSAVSSSESSA